MPHADLKISRRCVLAAAVIGVLLIASGLTVLAGWALDIAALKNIAVDYVSMKPNSALCFALTGIALVARTDRLEPPLFGFASPRAVRAVHMTCTILIVLVSTTTLGEYIFEPRLGIDTLLMHDAVVAEGATHPGRMSPFTATEFLLVGLALACLDIEARRRWRPAQSLALAIALVAFIAFLGYLYDVDVIYKEKAYATMALHTTTLFLFSSVGILLARPDTGVMAEITNTRVGAKMARSLLPVAIFAPVFIGWLRLKGERIGLYDEEFGLAIFAASNVLIFTTLIWINARSLNRAAISQSRTEETVVSTATELLKTTQQLEDSLERHRLAVEAAGLGTWHLDFSTQSLQFSDSCLRLYGFAPGTTVTRQQLRNVIHPEDRERSTSMRESVEHGEVRQYELEYRVIWPDGSEHWLAVKGEGEYDDTGRAVSMQGVAMDVTARKKDERDRERLQGQLRQSQKLNALGTLAAGIAHDFNNVLTAISGNVALAVGERSPPLPKDVHDNLSEIDKATRRASDLVQRILAFGRGQDAKPAATPLLPIVEEAVQLLRASISPMIELRVRSTNDLPNVFADVTQILQVIMNVATNAVHAIGDARGTIEFSVDVVKVNGDIVHTFADLEEGRYVRLGVTDDGCGMEKAVIDRIFEPFYTTKAPGRGTGLGLSVAHGIVKNAGGTITVYSQPNKGSKFHIYLPATEASAEKMRRAETAIVMGHGERVLYVDDEEALIFLVTRLLDRYNYAVTGYTDAAQALATFRGQPSAFDVVVTDLSMPQMSGFDFAQEVLQIRSNIPIILTSGYVRREDAERAQEIGIRQLLAKPNTVDELGGALSRLFADTPRQSNN